MRKMIMVCDVSGLDTRPLGEIDEGTGLGDMRNGCPVFFRTPHGQRETYTIYRGQLICRSTDIHARSGPVRRTSVYLFLPDGFTTEDQERVRSQLYCVSAGAASDDIREGQKLIDRIIDGGKYFHGI